ncbi:MAG: site-specific DNA-methyltransferase [Candidatus Micrarchaeota archaeon]|nr:site-specific DNA-methyltransferase [Candidatus Micrarchaeota archaeon]
MELRYEDKKSVSEILKNTMPAELQLGSTKQKNWFSDWSNLLIYGNNLNVLKTLYLNSNIRGKVKLIYIDPPFATEREFMDVNKNHAYSDKLNGHEYVEFVRERLIFLKELLSHDGSIYVHLDQKKGHYIKVIMDEIFGEFNFINDSRIDKNGRRYTTTPLHAPGETSNGPTGKAWKEMLPPKGRHWRYSPEELTRLDKAGLIEWSSTGNPRKIIYADENGGKKIQDVWEFKDLGIHYASYPTEKNLDLLKLIVQVSSNRNDIVLDCFAGSGTTLLAAEQFGRRWIGIDNSPMAIDVIQRKFIGLANPAPYKLLKAGS